MDDRSGQPIIAASIVREALLRGIAFLEAAQLPSGEIPIETSPTRDMAEPCAREQVVFCAALAARALADAPEADCVRARALDFLLAEMEPGGLWRHPARESPGHAYTPPDVDDTALASAALAAARRPIPDNCDLLAAQRLRSGLFRTWIVRRWFRPKKIRLFFKRYAKPQDVDSVVNANAVFYLGARPETEPAIAHMLSVLREGREMDSTLWYASCFTIWYFFSHALLRVAPDAGAIVLSRLESAVPGDAVERAFASSTLLLWGRLPDIRPLLADQLPSGGWPSVGFYHMGRRRPDAPSDPPWWGSQALTTMLAVEALGRYLRRCEALPTGD